MLNKKIFKNLLIALCLVGLGACQTTPDATTESNNTTTASIGDDANTETQTVTEPVISDEERMRMESEEKRQARTIYFEFDDSAVQQQYLAILELHAKFLVESGRKVTLEGHADERGTQAYNLALGERRAKAVSRYLMNYGLSEGQITVVSYGEERPADGGHRDGSWSKNRRVEVVYR